MGLARPKGSAVTNVSPFITPLIINGRAFTDLNYIPQDMLMPAAKAVKLDSFVGAGALIAGPGMPRGLWVGTAGNATMKDGFGNILTGFPLLAGFNPIMISELTSLSGAANIWGLY